MTAESLVSVIIPIHNSESTLRRCVESVLSQSHHAVEVLLINDGSTDRSADICDEILIGQPRVRVIHQENGGVSSARNAGLRECQGRYIQFVDSDDYLDPDMTRRLVEAACDGSPDLVIAGFVEIDIQTGHQREHRLPARRLSTIQEFLAELPDQKMVKVHSCCTKLFRTDMVRAHDLMFNTSLSWAEDTVFSLNYLSHCKTVSTLNSVGYFYTTGGSGENLTARFRADLYSHAIASHQALHEVYRGYPELSGTLDWFERDHALGLATNVVPHLAKHTPLSRFLNYKVECEAIRRDETYNGLAGRLTARGWRAKVLVALFHFSRFELVFVAGLLVKLAVGLRRAVVARCGRTTLRLS